ncbi:MAG: hypothetical protein LBS36_11235 [Oscillospiraceae bacterium]|nr:hypothetical protein [Oscillospiraceae bacterium]
MNKPRCKTDIRVLHGFLNATGGNWRNSVHIECNVCRYPPCDRQDFLFAPAEDGTPLLMPADDAEIVFGRMIDKSECLGMVSNARFQELFALFLKKYTGADPACPLLRLCAEQSKREDF